MSGLEVILLAIAITAGSEWLDSTRCPDDFEVFKGCPEEHYDGWSKEERYSDD